MPKRKKRKTTKKRKFKPATKKEIKVQTKKSKKKFSKPWFQYGFWFFPLALILFSYILILKDLPSPGKLDEYDIPLTTKVYDRNNTLLYDIYAELVIRKI